jgi:hypothetical protein
VAPSQIDGGRGRESQCSVFDPGVDLAHAEEPAGGAHGLRFCYLSLNNAALY